MDTRSGRQPETAHDSLQARLITFAVAICENVAGLPVGRAMERYGDQVIRSAGSVAAKYAEARAAESRRDFIHKMQICLKELRETGVWLEIIGQLTNPERVQDLATECDEVTRIFVASIRTARRR